MVGMDCSLQQETEAFVEIFSLCAAACLATKVAPATDCLAVVCSQNGPTCSKFQFASSRANGRHCEATSVPKVSTWRNHRPTV